MASAFSRNVAGWPGPSLVLHESPWIWSPTEHDLPLALLPVPNQLWNEDVISSISRYDVAHNDSSRALTAIIKKAAMKILLATDGSTYTKAATRSVISLLRTQDSEVLVLQIVEPVVFSTPPQMASGYAPETVLRLQGLIEEAQQSVSRTAEMLQTAGFKADSRVVESEIRTGILDTAKEWNADLIVLGSHGEKGLRKFFLGSVSESVARHAPCSVLIVRVPSDEASNP